jgi:hypothetical protein
MDQDLEILMRNQKDLELGMLKVRNFLFEFMLNICYESIDQSPRGSIDARKPLNLNIEPSIREGKCF